VFEIIMDSFIQDYIGIAFESKRDSRFWLPLSVCWNFNSVSKWLAGNCGPFFVYSINQKTV
jgi:hypothetical protein